MVFTTKKAAGEAGYKTRERWFKQFRAPMLGEIPVIVKGDEFFGFQQTEKLMSLSKGRKEIGELRADATPIGRKRLPRRPVKYMVYRESDFVYREKRTTKLHPPNKVDLVSAIAKLMETGQKYEASAKRVYGQGKRKFARGMRKRRDRVLELAAIGLQRAINMELVCYAGQRGKTHRYVGDGVIFVSKIDPPDWLSRCGAEPCSEYGNGSRCRLKDAVWTVEQIEQRNSL